VPSTTATHFALQVAPAAQVGLPTEVEVAALDASNQLVPSYSGTIQLTDTDTTTTLGGVALPATYTFGPGDFGEHFFQITPGAVGTDTITATDTTTSSITGSVALAVDSAPVATHFFVYATSHNWVGSAEVGVAASVAVVALDAANQPVRNYTGTVQITDTDTATTLGGAALPATYTFTTSDHGFHVFTLTPGAAGTDAITVSDVNNAITGSVDLTVNPAPVAIHLDVYAPSSHFGGGQVIAGAETPVVVAVLDASNHLVTSFTGTVTISSTDAAATLGGTALPTTYTFTASDHGSHVFELVPGAAGTETITVTDTTTSTITGSVALTVAAAPVTTHFLVLTDNFHDSNTTYAGVATPIAVVALDASNQIVHSYTGTVAISSTDAATTLGGTILPTSYTFTTADQGVHVFQITPGMAGTETISFADANTSSITGSVTLTVAAAPVATHIVVQVNHTSPEGQPTSVAVFVLDASNQLVPNFTGTIALTSTDTAATSGGMALPASYTFTAADNGVHVFSVTFGTAGSETVTATDAVDGFTASATTTVATLHFGFGNNPWGTYGNLFDNY
jgi:hypothetical protein